MRISTISALPGFTLILGLGGCEPEVPVPAELTIEACGDSNTCLGEGSHAGSGLGFECVDTRSRCRVFRVDLVNTDGQIAIWPEPAAPPGECIDVRESAYWDLNFEDFSHAGATIRGLCRTRVEDAITFVQTRLPSTRPVPLLIQSVVVEVWDWMQARWVQCWSVEPFETCTIKHSATANYNPANMDRSRDE